MKFKYKVCGVLFLLAILPICGKVFIKERIVFIKQFISNPSSIGSITPSSSFLGDEITKYISSQNGPIRVLEVGAGTGVFSEIVLSKLRSGDIFDVIEIEPALCEHLKKQFAGHENVKIHCLSILDWLPEYKYDYIVSGLPFNSLDADFVKNTLKHYESLIKSGGIISYFEYIALSDIKEVFLSGDGLENFKEVRALTSQFRSKYEFEMRKIFANFPPAYVHFLQVKK